MSRPRKLLVVFLTLVTTNFALTNIDRILVVVASVGEIIPHEDQRPGQYRLGMVAIATVTASMTLIFLLGLKQIREVDRRRDRDESRRGSKKPRPQRYERMRKWFV